MKKLTKLMTAILALSLVVTALTPVTAEAATVKDYHIYIASFDSDATNYVKSVSVNKKGQLVVKANFKRNYETKDFVTKWKSTGMKTFTFNPTDFGDGIDGGADYHRHNYKTGKTNPKFYHYTQKDFLKQVEKYMGTSWKLVITNDGDMVSAAIVKYSGTYADSSAQGWNENCNADEVNWARMWLCPVCYENLGYGPEALALYVKLYTFKLFCEDHEGVFYK